MTWATAVFLTDGSDLFPDGEEYRAWYVYLGDDEGEPVSCRAVQTFSSEGAAWDEAERLAKVHDLELVAD